MTRKSLYVGQYRNKFFPNIFHLRLVESTDVELADMQIYLYHHEVFS
jgi:hypothetical protein